MSKTPKHKMAHSEKLLTEVESEFMTILWRLGEGTVAEVIASLPKERTLAYTSVSTILRILEQKEVLKSRKEGRGHIYIPTLRKEEYEARTIRHVVDRIFDGTPVALVRQLVNNIELSASEIDEIKKLIKEKGGSK